MTPIAEIRRVSTAPVPTQWGTFECSVFDDGDVEHLAFVYGTPSDPTLVRIHSECLTGDIFGSRRCDCGPQLATAMQRIVDEGSGVLVYLRGHEGRGIGIGHKIAAYALQDAGSDTVDANVELGLPIDARDYASAAAVLTALGAHRVRLMTNNPEKCTGLAAHGIDVVERVVLPAHVTPENVGYLRTKRDRMGHLIDGL